MRLDHTHTQCPVPVEGDLHEHLLAVPEGQYDHRVVELLATASAWAYSDLGTYTDVLCRRGLDGEVVEISVKDEAMGVDVTVYVFQSQDRKLGIVTFRGTPPLNILNWLTCTSAARKVPFLGQGNVHGGLCNNALAVAPLIAEMLAALYTGKSIGDRLAQLTPKKPGKRPASELDTIAKGKRRLEALYVAGHGLGGSLAAMTAGAITMAPKLQPLQPLLRGVYAYGPARFADPTLAKALHEKIGKKVFLFFYQKDIVTRMPARMYGRYWHFGRRYLSSWRDGEWVNEIRPRRYFATRLAANVISGMAWMREVLVGGRVILPVSWVDHSPMNYVRISRNSNPGKEMP